METNPGLLWHEPDRVEPDRHRGPPSVLLGPSSKLHSKTLIYAVADRPSSPHGMPRRHSRRRPPACSQGMAALAMSATSGIMTVWVAQESAS
jgi:hypothetical protein